MGRGIFAEKNKFCSDGVYKVKICNGFITNSSSTSFVISSNGGLTEEKFLKAFGVSEESLLIDMYTNLYIAIRKNITRIPSGISIRNFLDENGVEIKDEEDVDEIERRYNKGEIVYWGKLNNSGNDGGMAEAFFTHESFVVVGEDIYFNARNSVY